VRTQSESWRMTYGAVAALALAGLAFSDVYRLPQSSAASPPPRRQLVRLDHDPEAAQFSTHRYIVPLHSLDDRSAPLNHDTPFIATKENPFAGKTSESEDASWALAAPNTGTERRRQEESDTRERAQPRETADDALFEITRQDIQRASVQAMLRTEEALRPFQELPQRLRPDSELLINFDSRGQVSLGTVAEKNAEYFYRMVARISEQWNIYFPKFQHFYGLLQEGDVLITFALDLDGRVGEIRLVRSYGQTSIDESCIQAIRAAADFGPIPAEYREQGGMVVPFAFVYHRPSKTYKLFH